VRGAVEFVIPRGQATTSPSEITLSPHTKRVVEYAIDEARKLGHAHVGTEHLLLGLLRDDGMASGILASLGVTVEKVRHQVIATLGQHGGEGARLASPVERPAVGAQAFGPPAPIDRLDHHAGEALIRAYWHAGAAGHAEIGPAHLLLALIGSDSQWLVPLWLELAIDPLALAAKIRAAAAPQSGGEDVSPRMATALLGTINRASALAAQRNRAFIRPEHLLLALAMGQDPAATALASAGATPERLREALERRGL